MADAESRLEELEVKVAFQEHTISQLDEVIRDIRDEMDRLRLELSQLHEHVLANDEPHVVEKPPHY